MRVDAYCAGPVGFAYIAPGKVAPFEMVWNHEPENQGQGCEGCDATRACSSGMLRAGRS